MLVISTAVRFSGKAWQLAARASTTPIAANGRLFLRLKARPMVPRLEICTMNRIWIVAAIMICLSPQVEADTPREVFEKRLAPIFRSPNPSSCVQCHLAGVDLKNYIRPTHEATFVSLRDQGLINLEQPEKSKILQLIRMGEEDKAGATLIHQKNRTAEYEAFALWIKESAADPALRQLPKAKAEDLASPARPVEVIRHARKNRLAESFVGQIAVRTTWCPKHTRSFAANHQADSGLGRRAQGSDGGLAESYLWSRRRHGGNMERD
jgi:hypothetical protein